MGNFNYGSDYATTRRKQGNSMLIFPDREKTKNLSVIHTGKIMQIKLKDITQGYISILGKPVKLCNQTYSETRMHSSRMRTARTMTVGGAGRDWGLL